MEESWRHLSRHNVFLEGEGESYIFHSHSSASRESLAEILGWRSSENKMYPLWRLKKRCSSGGVVFHLSGQRSHSGVP